MSSFIGNRYFSFDHLNPAHQEENAGSQKLPPEIASAQWDGSATAAYTLKDVPAAS